MAGIRRHELVAVLLVSVVFLPLTGCGGGGGNGEGGPDPTVTLTATPPNIIEGHSTTLAWSSTNATRVVYCDFPAPEVNGTAVVSPTATTVYAIIVQARDGDNARAEVCVTVTGGGDYVFAGAWRSVGSNWCPSDVAVDVSTLLPDLVYVVNDNPLYIRQLTTEGELLTQWGSAPQPHLGCGHSVAAAWPYVYVSYERLNSPCIKKFDSDGNFIMEWSWDPGPGVGLWEPVDLAVDPMREVVYVADRNSSSGFPRMTKFTSDGDFLTQWLFEFAGLDVGLGGVAVDPTDGNVYVVVATTPGGEQPRKSYIQKFTSQGALLTQWELPGPPPSGSWRPLDVAVDNLIMGGNVYVTDSANERIQIFDSEGRFLSYISFVGCPSRDNGIELKGGRLAVDTSGDVYVAAGPMGILKFHMQSQPSRPLAAGPNREASRPATRPPLLGSYAKGLGRN